MSETFFGYKLDGLGHWQGRVKLETELAAVDFVLSNKASHHVLVTDDGDKTVLEARNGKVIFPVILAFATEFDGSYSDAEKRAVVSSMTGYGGGFVSALGEALRRADHLNSLRIKAAFPDYWHKYLEMARVKGG